MKNYYFISVLSIQTSHFLGGESKLMDANYPVGVILSNLSLLENSAFIRNGVIWISFCLLLYFLMEYLREQLAGYRYSNGGCGIALQMSFPFGIHCQDEMSKDFANKEENLSSCLNALNNEQGKDESETENNSCVLWVASPGQFNDSLKNCLVKYFKVIVLANPDLIIGFAARLQLDAIIIDETVNGKSGDEICRRIKSNEIIANIPVVLLVKAEEVESYLLHSESGADHLESRTMDMGKFVVNLRMLIKNYAKLRKQIKPFLVPDVPSFLSNQVEKDNDNMKFMKKVHALVEANISNDKYTISDLVVEMGLSRTSFFNKFKEITGQAPKDYIFSLKMDVAAKLLLYPNLNVTEVSGMLGFCDSKYFAKRFKETYDVCPTKYVQQMHEKKEV